MVWPHLTQFDKNYIALGLADIYWAGLLGPKIQLILFTQCEFSSTHTHTHTHNHFMALPDFVRDYPRELVPKR